MPSAIAKVVDFAAAMCYNASTIKDQAMPRQPTCNVYFISHDATDHTITLSVRGTRYEYTLNPQACETVIQLCRKGLGRRALNYAKSRARNVERISVISTS